MIENKCLEYSEEKALHWMLQAARALQYLHQFQYERYAPIDVKPLNMFLDEKYRTLKLCDSNQIDNEDDRNIYDTFVYMAPEAKLKEKYNQKSDVYAWAISLEYCLTRIMPFLSYEKDFQYLLLTKTPDQYGKAIFRNKFIRWLIDNCTEDGVFIRFSMNNIVEELEKYLEKLEIPEVRIVNHPGKLIINLSNFEHK